MLASLSLALRAPGSCPSAVCRHLASDFSGLLGSSVFPCFHDLDSFNVTGSLWTWEETLLFSQQGMTPNDIPTRKQKGPEGSQVITTQLLPHEALPIFCSSPIRLPDKPQDLSKFPARLGVAGHWSTVRQSVLG